MHVFVAGGTGAIGRRLVPRLVGAGHRVTATTTTPAKLAGLRAAGAEAVVMDGLDAAAVGEAVARARPDAIVHQMTALAGLADLRRFDRSFAVTNALRTTGTDALLAAGAAAGVRRFVAQSYTGWPYARDGAAVKTEEDALDADPPAAQRETLAALRHLERAVAETPLDGVALRYGALYGPGASDELVALVRRRRLPVLGDGAGIWSWLHVDDAAAATVAALERGTGVLNVVDDDPAPVAEWLPALAEAVGAPPPRRVPVWLGRLAAGEAGVSLMTRVRGASNARAKRELAWQPAWPSWREGFRHGLADTTAATA
jgi:nucleoside-diphosphate-sugar epimerase